MVSNALAFIQKVQTIFLSGLVFALIIYGISFLQVCRYFKRFPRDGFAPKATVLTLWLLDTIGTIMAVLAFHHLTIAAAGDMSKFLPVPRTLGVEVLSITPINLITQAFFAYQIFILSRNWYVLGVLGLLSLASFAYGLYFHILWLTQDDNIMNFGAAYRTTNAVYQSLVTATDLLIVFGIRYFLQATAPKLKASQSLIKSLIITAVARGVVTTFFQFITVILVAARPAKFEWLAFHLIVGKVSVLSVFVTLNLRTTMHKKDVVISGSNPGQASGGIRFAAGESSSTLVSQESAHTSKEFV